MKTTKRFLIFALILCGIGIAVAFTAFALAGFTFRGFTEEKYEDTHYDISGDFNFIEIDDETTEIIFKLSETGNYIECHEKVSQRHSVKVSENKLEIKLEHKSILDFLTFSTEKTTMTVYLVGRYYDGLEIDTHTGDITIPSDFLFHEVSMEVTTGDIRFDGRVEETLEIEGTTGELEFQNTEFGTLKTNTTTGGCKLKDILVSKKIDLKSTTGNITLKDCDAPAVYIQTTTGNVDCGFLTNKTFKTETATGTVNVPSLTSGGMCQIKTTTGNITGKVGK